jgi:hypothetical protein
MASPDRLSPLDASFLHIENATVGEDAHDPAATS